MAFAAFDVLAIGGHPVMREPWTSRPKRLEGLLELERPAGVCLVPVTDDAASLWETWVGMGGEGIVLKDRRAIYRPGVRSPAWLKLKPKLTLEAVVTGGSADRVAWGDWGEAVMLELRYVHPRTGNEVAIRQAVRVPQDMPFMPVAGGHIEVVCWGVMPSGLLRHPVLISPSGIGGIRSAR